MTEASPIPVLIVDDDPVFALFVRQLVLSLGGEMTCAPQCVDTAEKALAALGRSTFELVLLDYNLPDADGLEVLARIRSLPETKQPAVVMLTASGNEAIAVEAMKRGAKDYLGKAGLDVPPLMRALQTALRQKKLADQVAEYHAQVEADLEMARNLQRALLPEHYPTFPPRATPAESALRFCHRYQPAARLAGDFFEVIRLSDSRAGVLICDVMGHGVRSALVTAMLRALVDDLAPGFGDPAQFLTEMNRRLAGLFKHASGALFATAFYLIADLERGEMCYANAGHPRPLHLQPGLAQVNRLELPPSCGPALGLFGEARYVGAQRPLNPGDIVLLFTDGLVEVENADAGEDFGPERLLAATRARLDLPPGKMLEELIAEVRRYSGGAEFSDDICLLAMERAA
jgi:sigma-B regulation protein RsbU (phosphoserine phosphatase)